MANEWVFGFQKLAFACPWHVGIIDAGWHAIIANGNDFVFVIYDASANLSIGIFTTFGGEMGDAHEVFVPGDVVFTHFSHSLFVSII